LVGVGAPRPHPRLKGGGPMALADPVPSRLHRIRRFDWSRTPLSLRIGGTILAFHLILAAIGPFIAPYGYSQMGAGIPLSGMSWAHPFGVDQLGRDIFSRVVHGGHTVMLLSLSATFLGLVVGAFLGLLSGYVRGWFDAFLQRVIEAII